VQNVSIATSISKEEREAGVKQTYIGNGKVVMDKSKEDRIPQAPPAPSAISSDNDLPF
jgi:hypothetical protein